MLLRHKFAKLYLRQYFEGFIASAEEFFLARTFFPIALRSS
jgi:hypothetical protein